MTLNDRNNNCYAISRAMRSTVQHFVHGISRFLRAVSKTPQYFHGLRGSNKN